MNAFRLLIRAIVAFFAGIVFAHFWLSSSFLPLVMLLIGGLYFLLIDVFITWRRLLFVLLMVFFGFFRLFYAEITFKTALYGKVADEMCVVEEVDLRIDNVRYVLENANGARILAVSNKYPRYSFGDCLNFEGKIAKPGFVEEFDYGAYLKRAGVYGVSYYPQLEVVEPAENGFFEVIFRFKESFYRRLEQIFLEPEGGLIAGLFLGTRGGLAPDLMEDFNRVGLTHIVAISGYNITILIVFVSFLFGFLEKYRRIIFAIVVIALFVIFTGMSASVVRAGLMGVISLLVLFFGRAYYVGLALFYSAFLMVLFDPKALFLDLGFQLSFLATIGVVYLGSHLEKYFSMLPNIWGLRETFILSVAAQIITLPLITASFGRVSLLAPLVNLLVLPFIPLIMLGGFLAVLASFISFGLAKIFGFAVFVMIRLVMKMVEFFANLPFASFEVPKVSGWLVALIYFFIFRALFLKRTFKLFN